MALLQTPAVVALLWVIAGLATLWVLGPAIGFLVARGPMQAEVNGDPRGAEPGGGDRDYADRARQLMALGFRPVGTMIETMRFFTPLHWWWRSDGSRWLASPEGDLFVGMFRIAGAGPLRTTVMTLFEGGGLVETAVSKAGVAVDFGELGRRFEVDGDDLGQLLARHRHHVEVVAQLRGTVVKRATLSQVGTALALFGQRATSKSRVAGTYAVFTVFLMPLIAVIQTPGRADSPLAVVRPLAICAFALMFASVRWVTLPSRVPKLVRVGVMFVLLSAPMLIGFGIAGRRQVSRAPDPSVETGRTDPSR